jgi:protein tyrosine/serine phosphatase
MQFRAIRVHGGVTTLLAVLTMASSAVAGAGQTSSIHIDNFGRVSSTYYRGAQPRNDDYAALAALGVKTVINLTSGDADPSEQAMVTRAGMKYVQIPMTTHQPPSDAELDAFLKLVNDPLSQPVYVHCVGGRHRTGIMTAVYRMAQDGWTADQAFREMKQFRFGADFLHPEFKQFVYAFHPRGVRNAALPAIAGAAPAAKAGSQQEPFRDR